MPAEIDNTNVSRFSSLGVGGTFLAGVLTAAAASSIFLGGDVHFDESIDATPKLIAGTGGFLGYGEALCTNTGGLAKYTACSWQNPSTTLTGTLIRVEVDTESAPTAATITCATSPDGTATGVAIFKYVATASGFAVGTGQPVNVGAGTGGRLISVPPSDYVRCWHSTTPGPGLKEQLRVWFADFYAP